MVNDKYDPPYLLNREGMPPFKHRVEALIREKAAKRAAENAKRDMNQQLKDMDYRK